MGLKYNFGKVLGSTYNFEKVLGSKYTYRIVLGSKYNLEKGIKLFYFEKSFPLKSILK